MSLRALAVTALLGLAATCATAQARPDGGALPAMPGAWTGRAPVTDRAARAALMRRGEAALAAGDATAAREAFERAAQMQHAADIEIGIVRTQMLEGEYRQALAFASHTAGAHRDVAAGAALYGWLLHLGGQHAVARRLLDAARQTQPTDPDLASVGALVNPGPDGDAPPALPSFAPRSFGASVPDTARAVGSALLLADGRRAIAPLELVDSAEAIWVRNGLGRTVAARISRRDPESRLALLRLDGALDEVPSQWAAREAFPGSPAFLAAAGDGRSAQAAWPRLQLGFLGMPSADGARLLGIPLPQGGAGAPVVDGQGRLVGMAMGPRPDSQPRLASMQSLRSLAGDTGTDPEAPGAAVAVDEIYERALRNSLQILIGTLDRAAAHDPETSDTEHLSFRNIGEGAQAQDPGPSHTASAHGVQCVIGSAVVGSRSPPCLHRP